jgi:Arc/MetJ-type ribon-helix-helix transcriptional regulator
MSPAERFGPADEKVTINVGPVDLGKIDLLVSEGLYGSRTDLIRDAIRRQLERHEVLVNEVVTRREFVVGFTSYNRTDFERFRSKGQRIKMRVVGVARLAPDITPELADEVIEDISVMGSLRASKPVLEILKSRREREGATP